MGGLIYAYFFERSTDTFAPEIAALLRKQYQLQREMEGERGKQHLTALCTLLKKLIALCRSQKEWWVYLESLYCLSIIYEQTGRNTEAIPLIMEYLTASKEHMDDIMSKYPESSEDMEGSHCFNLMVIANSFRDFYQFDDDKLDKLLQIFADAANSGESKRYYCEAKIQIDLMNHDCTAALKTYKELIKLPRGSCYMCSSSMLIEYYVMMDQPDQAIAWIEKMLRQDVPKDSLEMFPDCIWLSPSTLYSHFLYVAAKHGKTALFLQHKDHYCDTILPGSRSVDHFSFFVLAVNKAYATLKELLPIFCKNINLISGEAPLCQLEEYLCYSAYFYNLHKTGVNFVKLAHLEKPLDVLTKNGAYSTAALAKYMQKSADLLGSKFDKGRKGFSYQKLKNAYIQLRDK